MSPLLSSTNKQIDVVVITASSITFNLRGLLVKTLYSLYSLISTTQVNISVSEKFNYASKIW